MSSERLNNVGFEVLVARRTAKMTQKELAAKVGATITHISHIENDRAEPSLALLKKIAEATGTHISIELVRYS